MIRTRALLAFLVCLIEIRQNHILHQSLKNAPLESPDAGPEKVSEAVFFLPLRFPPASLFRSERRAHRRVPLQTELARPGTSIRGDGKFNTTRESRRGQACRGRRVPPLTPHLHPLPQGARRKFRRMKGAGIDRPGLWPGCPPLH